MDLSGQVLNVPSKLEIPFEVLPITAFQIWCGTKATPISSVPFRIIYFLYIIGLF